MAINHYIEAKVYQKAIEAALNARQFLRALQLVDVIDSETSRPYYKQLARYYEESNQYDLAERCYVSADQPNLAVEMHTRLGHWEIAHKLATSYMSAGNYCYYIYYHHHINYDLLCIFVYSIHCFILIIIIIVVSSAIVFLIVIIICIIHVIFFQVRLVYYI